MKLLAVVVLYYPNINETISFIDRYINDVDKLILWINTPEVDKLEIPILSQHQNKTLIMGTGKNEGIGYALNKGIEWALNNGFSHILTMDQDSCFEKGHFKKYRNFISLCNENNILVYCPRLATIHKSLNTSLIDLKFTITSGSIINLSLFKIVGLFREDFFIDGIDTEYSIRGRSLGYRTVMINNCILKQRFGEARISKWGFMSSDYNAFRTYHMVRNHIIIWKLYPLLFSFNDAFKIYVFQRSIKIILSEDNKLIKLKAMYFGINHGLRNKIKPYQVT